MTGIELAIQMGSLDALNVFLDRIAEFKASPRAVNLGSAIGNYALKDASWRPPLKGLLAMHLGIHDLDWGAAGAIAKLRDPADLPFLVTFLDHEDPNLVWMVGRHLASFARTNQIYTNQVKQYEQVKILSMPNAQYAELWKSWWEANKAALRIR